MPYTPPYAAQLQMGSWRGIQFATRKVTSQPGRRFAVHEYYGADLPYVEDTGRSVERVSFDAFVSGADVYGLRDRLVAACNTKGLGDLVHPSRGALTAACIGCTFSEAAEDGDMLAISLEFVLSAPSTPMMLTPRQSADTQSDADDDADDADDASSEDFFSRVGDAYASGVQAVQAGVATVQHFAARVQAVVGDAQRVVGAVRGVGSILGAGTVVSRYDGLSSGIGATGFAKSPGGGILAGLSTGLSDVRRVQQGTAALLSAATTVRSAVSSAADAALTQGGLL